MIQAVNIDGAVIVTTPQAIAVQDAVRGVEMFKKLHVPIVGIVENMSFFSLPDGSMVHPFGRGGGFETAIAYQVPLLAQLPLDERIRLGGDMGMPVALASDESCMPFVQLAENVLAGL
jgi:ATP-binding protein involved in chromosome partitioning